MDFFYVGILAFLIILATFDLSVGVANDAVNFLSPAVGAKTAKFRTILLVAAIGIFVGASTSSGMMDIARHGILNPLYYTFDDVMCIFLAVAATDVILLDIFNTLGMPTSTTVSMVFGLLGGSTALAFSKMVSAGMPYAQLINTDKALSVIIGIFLSVAIAFVVGLIVMWLTRVVFTFEYKNTCATVSPSSAASASPASSTSSSQADCAPATCCTTSAGLRNGLTHTRSPSF